MLVIVCLESLTNILSGDGISQLGVIASYVHFGFSLGATTDGKGRMYSRQSGPRAPSLPPLIT